MEHNDIAGINMLSSSVKQNDKAGNRTNQLTRKKTRQYNDIAGNNTLSYKTHTDQNKWREAELIIYLEKTQRTQ